MENTDFDAQKAEASELDALLERGMRFTVPKKSILRFVGGRERGFYIHQPYLGTLYHLSREFLAMELDEERLAQNPLGEAKSVVQKSARRCARIVAIAILNNRLGIRFLTRPMAWYLLWRINPAKLFQITMLINQINNYADFINSIRYLSIQNRTTSPALMEKKREPQD